MPQLRNSPTRQDTWLVVIHLEGNSMGVWDKKDGGEVDSDDNKYYPGGMVKPISLGGKVTTGNVTLARIYDRVDDHDKINDWYQAAGHGRITVSQRPLDFNGNPVGRPIIMAGTLKRVLTPAVDSTGTGPAMFEVECIIEGLPAAA